MNTQRKQGGKECAIMSILTLCVVIGLFYTGVQTLWDQKPYSLVANIK